MASETESFNSWDLEGIQCFFDDKDYVQSVWAFEAVKWLSQLNAQLQTVRIQNSKPEMLKLTRQRTKHLIGEIEFQINQLGKLLDPLNWKSINQNQAVSYLGHRPGASELSVSFNNVFRDWCWGEKENQVSLDKIISCLPDNRTFNKAIVLGCGAGKLSLDLSLSLKVSHWTLVDYNPLLLLIAKKMFEGDPLELVEFPIVPKNSASFAVRQFLKSKETIQTPVDFVAADVRNLPFKNGDFDFVLTPWLVDVVRSDFQETLSKINQLLPLGGTWVNFGPLGFNNPILADYYSYEEVIYLLKKMGFEVIESSYDFIPYMQSPHSNHRRNERVLIVSAKKVKEVSYQGTKSRELYDWEVDPESLIEIPVVELNLAAGHDLNSFVFKLLETPKSLKQLAEILFKEKGIAQDQAFYLLQNIIRDAQRMALQNPQAQ